MAKLLYSDEIYEEISPSAYYESEYEALVFSHAEHLYSSYHIIPFKSTVYSENGSARGDFALIDMKYRDWWVGEIELATHSLEGHVLPQIEVLSCAIYGQKEAEYIHSKKPDLDLEKLCDLMKGQQPRVIVIVNASCPKWINPLKRHNAILAIFEIFKSFRDKMIFRINGEHPTPFSTMMSDCIAHELLPRLLQVLSPGILSVRTNEKITVKYRGALSEWKRIDIQDAVYIQPLKGYPFSPRKHYKLRLHEDGALELVELKSRRRL